MGIVSRNLEGSSRGAQGYMLKSYKKTIYPWLLCFPYLGFRGAGVQAGPVQPEGGELQDRLRPELHPFIL